MIKWITLHLVPDPDSQCTVYRKAMLIRIRIQDQTITIYQAFRDFADNWRVPLSLWSTRIMVEGSMMRLQNKELC
jgi:hypothetical protein